MLEAIDGNKDKVANTQGWCAPTEMWTPAGKSWAVTDTDLVSPQSGWRVGLCKRPGTCMEWQAWVGGIFQKKKKRKKRHSVAVWGILLQQLALVLPPYPCLATVVVLLLWQWRTQAHIWSPGDSAHLTLPPRGTSHPAPVPRVLQGHWPSKRKAEDPTEENCRAQGVSNPQKDLTCCGGWTTLKGCWESLASRTAKSQKMVCELPLICAPQGQCYWWKEGIGQAQKGRWGPGSKLRNWTGGWVTVKL